MYYKIFYKEPHKRFVNIEFHVQTNNKSEITIKLPCWRPGRYELGNFAKNIQKFEVADATASPLEYKKTGKDSWLIQTKGAREVVVKYNYFSIELNAGSTWIDSEQLYVNGANCLLYVEEYINEPCLLEIDVPENFKIAIGLKKDGYNKYIAGNYHHLIDCPFIASDKLKHDMFVLDGVEINMWVMGESKPAWSKMLNDFFIFINEQFMIFKEFVADDYHFLFQFMPTNFHHGVEHINSTVIAMGPTYHLMDKKLYNEFLGISCHEFFHSWNIKFIRPAEMLPYDYTKENYSRLGYVYEGVTTYYGDYLLYRSGIFKDDDYFLCLGELLDKHFENSGRLNMSVADSSFDTWLDGYTPGIPGRKVSIYTEGALCAFMLDVLIRKNTNNSKSLDDVMRSLYKLAKDGKGYTEASYRAIAEEHAGISLPQLFDELINGTKSFEPLLKECLNYVGLEWCEKTSPKFYDSYFGFKVSEESTGIKVKSVYPDSIAEKAGLSVGDKIVLINGMDPGSNKLDEWATFFDSHEITLSVVSFFTTKQVVMKKTSELFYKNFSVQKVSNPDEAQKRNFKAWSKRDF